MLCLHSENALRKRFPWATDEIIKMTKFIKEFELEDKVSNCSNFHELYLDARKYYEAYVKRARKIYYDMLKIQKIKTCSRKLRKYGITYKSTVTNKISFVFKLSGIGSMKN